MSKFLKNIFSITNENCHKVVTVLGVKLKIKSKTSALKIRIDGINSRLSKIEAGHKKEIADLKKIISKQENEIKNLKILIEEIYKLLPRKRTAERILPENYLFNIYDYVLFLKHKFAYELALKNIKSDYKVLEIGFGDGYGTDIIAKSGASIVAVELDEESLKQAKEKYNSPNISFDLYDGVNLNYEPYSFDMIISYQVIEHVENVDLYLNNIKKMLKPNGIFMITTPSRTYRLTPDQAPWNKYHLREYNSDCLKADSAKILDNGNIFSITARDEVKNIEFSRAKRNRADFDKNKEVKQDLPKDFVSRYSTADFYVDDKNLDDGLDLLLTNLNVKDLMIYGEK